MSEEEQPKEGGEESTPAEGSSEEPVAEPKEGDSSEETE